MIILPNQKLGFIAITKCASTTIEAALKGHKAVATAGTAGLKHLPYRHVEQYILPLLAARSVERPHFFAVVRHPAARILSWYNFRTRDALDAEPSSRKTVRYVGDISLEDFVEIAVSGKKGEHGRVDTQHRYVTDASGKVAVDTLIKIEHLDALLPGFLRRFGVQMESSPTRMNVSPTTVTGNMPEALVRKIVNSDRFGPDLELYHKGIETLPDTLPPPKRRGKRIKSKATGTEVAEELE